MGTALTLIGYVLAGVIGYVIRHAQIPKHHKIVDKALSDRAEAEAKAVVAGLFTPPAPVAEAPKK